MAFAMTLRTVAIDRLVQMAIARGVDTVINLGAGLDTRPYRMELPPTLRKLPPMFPWNILIFLFPKKMQKIANATYGWVMYGRD